MNGNKAQRYVMSAISLGICDGVHVQMLRHDPNNALHKDAELWVKHRDVKGIEAALKACLDEMCAYEVSRDPNDPTLAVVNQARNALGMRPL